MPSTLEFPEVTRATRRAWWYALGTSALGATFLGAYLLGTEDALPFPWYVALPFSLTCYALALVTKHVLDELRGTNVAQAAELSASAPTSPLVLRNAPWLSFPVAWLPAGWLAPRLEWSADEVVLTSRYGVRRIHKAEIRSARADSGGVELVLRSGEALTLRTADLPRSALERVHAPLARALFSARARALDFNQALARELAAKDAR